MIAFLAVLGADGAARRRLLPRHWRTGHGLAERRPAPTDVMIALGAAAGAASGGRRGRPDLRARAAARPALVLGAAPGARGSCLDLAPYVNRADDVPEAWRPHQRSAWSAPPAALYPAVAGLLLGAAVAGTVATCPHSPIEPV